MERDNRIKNSETRIADIIIIAFTTVVFLLSVAAILINIQRA